MEIPVNAQVICSDGECGKSACIIVNPVTDQVTHLVVKSSEGRQSEIIVQADLITETTHHEIHLRCSKADLDKMDDFVKTEFVEERIPEGYSGYSEPYGIGTRFLWPYVSAEKTVRVPVENRQIPLGELTMRQGAKVKAVDGMIGRIDEFVVNPENEHITHIVMRKGHLWGQREVTIPVSAIKATYRDLVELTINKDQVNALPSVKLDRKWNEN